MGNKISVITVVYNDAKHIRATMESFFSQTWEDKEYIVIDGGSTDGTADIIKEYQDQLTYWCSEPDGGIYEAINKGIGYCNGDWINILNSGDIYSSAHSLENALSMTNSKDIEIIYGNSFEIDKGIYKPMLADDRVGNMEYYPIYRHGSSLVKTDVHLQYLFNLNKKSKLGFALDWDQIFNMYKAGCKFQKVDTFIQNYNRDGISNNAIKSLWYNYKITTQYSFSFKKLAFFIKAILYTIISKSIIYKWLHAFLMEFIINDILPHIPFWKCRKFILHFAKMKLGKNSFIMKRNYILSPSMIDIGEYTTINRGCFLDGRGKISIGKNVSISHEVKLVTGGHDIQSESFEEKYMPIIIKDKAWIGIGSIILQGVTIGKGAVVCAGAVVTKDVGDYEVVAGVPARKIKTRNKKIYYNCIWDAPFT